MVLTELSLTALTQQPPAFEFPNGVWMAGGFLRDSIAGTKPNDIDIFARDADQLTKFKEVNLKGAVELFKTGNLATYEYQGWKVQLISKYFGSMEALLDSFDFTICQFAYNGKLYCNPDSLVHLFQKKLIVHKLEGLYVLDSMRRMQKYIQRGFTICNGGLMEFMKAIRAASEADIKTSFEYYPITNTTRIKRWD